MSDPSPTYRIYCYDSAQEAVTSDWLDASTDEEAIAEAEARGFGTKCEIWDGDRIVAKLGAEQPLGGDNLDGGNLAGGGEFGEPLTA